MNTEELNSLFQSGLANDLFMSQIHYFVFRTLGENHERINTLDDKEQKQHLIYLQFSSHDLSIQYLARVFDKRMKYETSSLALILEKCREIKLKDFLLILEYEHLNNDLQPYPAINHLEEVSGIKIGVKEIGKPEILFDWIKSILETEKINNAIIQLKTVRDKFIAHNELNSGIEALDDFWSGYALLIKIGRLMTSLLSEIFTDTIYDHSVTIRPDEINMNVLLEVNWLIEYLEKILGRDSVTAWWE